MTNGAMEATAPDQQQQVKFIGKLVVHLNESLLSGCRQLRQSISRSVREQGDGRSP